MSWILGFPTGKMATCCRQVLKTMKYPHSKESNLLGSTTAWTYSHSQKSDGVSPTNISNLFLYHLTKKI
jgi:hypothetical protein